MSYYNQHMYESIQVPDFFTVSEVNEIKNNYIELEEIILEEFFETPRSKAKLSVVHIMNRESNDITSIARICTVANNYISHEGVDDPEFKLFMASIDTDWLKDVKVLLRKRLLEHDRDPGDITTISFFDFLVPFETHCDGFDLSEDVKHMRRDDPLISEKVEELKQKVSQYNTHQGLINLEADPHYGTIIFNQWYPMSVYCDFDKDNTSRWSTGWGPYKETIQFYDGDTPERYGEHIRNFTHKYMPEDEYDIITQHDTIHFSRKSSYGLSLEKQLLFGEPGTMIGWDSKKFHKPKPFPRKPYIDSLDRNRLCLQYECIVRKAR